MLGHGYRGVYDPAAFGEGLMPLDFDGLKKQRFRWALGGIQILKFHWRELLPFVRHKLRLTRPQRIHYLLGSVQWFGDVITAGFTLFLLVTAFGLALHHRFPIRPLTGAFLVVPLVFMSTGLLRATWALKQTAHCSWGDAVRALRVWFALSWVVALACITGLIRRQAAFLRTPKHKEGETGLLEAVSSARAETTLGVVAVLGAGAMLLRSPSITVLALAAMLLFEGAIYLSATWASAAAEGIALTPFRRTYARSPQNTGQRPIVGAAKLAVPAAGVAAVAAFLVATVFGTAPTTPAPFAGTPPGELPKLGQVAPGLQQPIVAAPVTSPSPLAPPVESPLPSPAASPSPLASPAGASPAPVASPGAATPLVAPSP